MPRAAGTDALEHTRPAVAANRFKRQLKVHLSLSAEALRTIVGERVSPELQWTNTRPPAQAIPGTPEPHRTLVAHSTGAVLA